MRATVIRALLFIHLHIRRRAARAAEELREAELRPGTGPAAAAAPETVPDAEH